ncbi:ABC transporter ATP-binding protein [Falsirhodobacter sp. 1013]|uniref:ABC transporter ATP-binding protein n=1 Tax=Falsirhodobacter sp. 1013 TaxID=3417566 RepID=UPI003EBC5A2C
MTASIHSTAQGIRLKGVTKSYDGAHQTIPPMDLEMRAGEFTVILGPSGCGKSTLLQMLAGLERVTAGTIEIGGREVQDLEPKARGLAMVFQNYALYPHMTVAENIGYSLRVAGMGKTERAAKVQAVAGMLGLGDLLVRKPSQLSGGQRQRVAIGRAIIREPGVLLFDEPLSNLDAQLRHDMRLELGELHRRIGATSVFVTHDQVEAMTLADRILILSKGRIEQFDTPKAIYSRPASTFVARFIGAPPMNILQVSGDGHRLRLADGQVLAASPLRGDFQLGIRPEDILLIKDAPLRARLRYREDLGSHSVLTATMDLAEIRIATPFGAAPPEGSDLALRFPPEKLHLFDTAGLRVETTFAESRVFS